jgi:hypothetical protein
MIRKVTCAVGAAGLAGAAALGLAATASASPMAQTSHGYHFRTIDNTNDLTFNQLLGINAAGKIAGYFGSGMAGHPNKGYTIKMPYHQGNFNNENFPGSIQTQVTGLNDVGNTVGFWADSTGANFGFYTSTNGSFHEVNFPGAHNSSPQVDQLLGINDRGVAVGFYNNMAGNARGYLYNIHTKKFSRVLKPGTNVNTTPSLTATAINNYGVVAGFYVTSGGKTDGFVKSGRSFTKLAYPGASMTQAFGINDSGEVVGAYTKGSGSSATSFGFTWTRSHGFKSVSDPHGIGTTLINGVNDRGELVGFYVDGAGSTDGFLATK